METKKKEKKETLKFENKKEVKKSAGKKTKQTSPSIKNKEEVFNDSGLQGRAEKVLKKDYTGRIIAGLSIASLVLIMVVAGQFFVLENKFPSNTLGKGTVINGVNVSGKTLGEASEIVKNSFLQKADKFELVIKHKGKEWKFTKEDFKVNSNIHTIIEESQKRESLIDGTTEKKASVLDEFNRKGASIHVAFNYIFVGLDSKIEEILAEVEEPAENSKVIFSPESDDLFEITEAKTGRRVNKEKLYYDINNQFVKGSKVSVELEIVEEAAAITAETNRANTQKVSRFVTNVSDSTGARKSNVKLALNKINGLVVEPGEEVSFNKLTGPHTLQSGYKVATVIYNGQFTDGVGGGICQASTTLYNALLKAGAEITSVRKHTLPVKYVPLALDAMVAEYVADLKFKNTTDSPMYIKTGSNAESVFVEVYGQPLPEGIEIKTRSETIQTLPHSGDVVKPDTKKEYTDKVLFKGEQYRLSYPRDGVEAKSYIQIYKNGELLEEKEIRHERYAPQNGIIIEGTEVPPPGLNTIKDNVKNEKEAEESFVPTALAP